MEAVRRPVRTVGWRDAWLPAAVLALGVLELWTLRTDGWIAGAALEGVAAALLVGRTRWPWMVVLALAALLAIPFTGTAMDDAATPILFIVIGIFALGRYAGPREGPLLVAGVLGLVALDYSFVDTRNHDWTDVVFVLSLSMPPFVFGRIVQRLDEQGRLLRAQQDQIRDQAVRDERDRIARELHDVIAHSVSAMVVQTAAAQDLVRTDPARAAKLLEQVAETGREALSETGRLLHLIRDDADELGLAPAPGLVDLPVLLDDFRRSGLAVDASLDLPADPLPGGLDVSAYRVVQEALTNARRHGDGTAALVVGPGSGGLRITCTNPVGRADTSGSGLGLQGMAERVGILGGRLSHGADTEGRFRLEATIPVPDVGPDAAGSEGPPVRSLPAPADASPASAAVEPRA